ncbi:MAG: PorP/SprF family type IX secretion system membrane protein [Bacteroidota bacterium]
MKQLHAISFAILCLCTGTIFGQQESAITQFWNTYQYSNPATTGLFYKHAAIAHYRNQWVGVNGAPNTLSANYAMRLDAIRSGVGIAYQYNEIGFNRTNKVLGNYAYHLKLGETSLSFGVAGGIEFLRVKYPEFITPTPAEDPAVPSGDTRYDPRFTSNVGIVFHSNYFNAGISCTQLNEPNFKWGTTSYTNARHYWLFLEYEHYFLETILLQPRIQIVTDAVKATYMASLMVSFDNNLWGGINYSVDNYIGGMIGYDFRGKYRIGYGYDMTSNKLSTISKGTHEIVLSYLLE